MGKIVLFHGSPQVVPAPSLEKGKATNDYGRGFYCTKSAEMAKEWACKSGTNGFINEYEWDDDDLKILNLLEKPYTAMHWIAILLKNRTFSLQHPIARTARDYIIANFGIERGDCDAIIGYRADDSYFSFAQSFVENSLPFGALKRALLLGELGEQTALVSEKAFDRLRFIQSELVDKTLYYPKFKSRDENARAKYINEIKNAPFVPDDVFVMDILRQEMKSDDPRLQ